MSEHRPTIVNDPDQDGEALDADLLPEEFPDDRPLASRAFGTTEAEQARGESLSRKLRREEPEVSDDGTDDGEDDAEDDSPDIMSVLDESGNDTTETLTSIRGRADRHGDDSGQMQTSRSAEEDAIHVVDGDTDLDAVSVSTLAIQDAEEFLGAIKRSTSLHHPWVEPPADAEAFAELLSRDPERFRTYAIRCDDGLVGVVNASEIVMSRFQSAYMSYYAFTDCAGRGLMAAGTRLVLKELFDTVGLHRVEANIRPENERSVQFIQRLGFRREGYSPSYLFLDGKWRDHERWALLATDPR